MKRSSSRTVEFFLNAKHIFAYYFLIKNVLCSELIRPSVAIISICSELIRPSVATISICSELIRPCVATISIIRSSLFFKVIFGYELIAKIKLTC